MQNRRYVQRIQQQLRNAVEGGAWHGPAVQEVVRGLSAEEAAARPLPGVHTPWEIVLHTTTWLETVRRRLAGEDRKPTAAEDWPSVPEPGEAGWAGARDRLAAAHDALQRALEPLRDADLERPVVGQAYDVYFMLHGVIQHTLYHAGQLAILGKAERYPDD